MTRSTHRAAAASEQQKAPVRFGERSFASFVVVLVAAVLFAVLLFLVRSKWSGLLNVDKGVANDLHEFARSHPSFISAMRLASAIGTTVAWWIVLGLVVIWLAIRRLPRLAVFVVVASLGSSLLNNVIKVVVDRARPHLPDPVASAGGTSFPSGHAQAAIVGYGILLLIFLPAIARRARPWVIGLAAVLVLTIGFSRIALGVHYLSDVVGGYLIGAAWLIAMTVAFSAWRRDEGKPAVRPTEGLEPEQQERISPGQPVHAPPEGPLRAESKDRS